jgi:hypothetical protein
VDFFLKRVDFYIGLEKREKKLDLSLHLADIRALRNFRREKVDHVFIMKYMLVAIIWVD